MPGARVLLALDLDGTLLAAGERPTPRVRSAVRHLAASGVMVVLATGRHVHGIASVIAELDLTETWVVASDGAILARFERGHRVMLGTQTFDPRPLETALRELDPDITLGSEDVGVGYLVNRPFQRVIARDHRQHVVETFPTAVTMMTAASTQVSGAQLVDAARALGLSCSGGDEQGLGWLDAGPPGVSKASGVASLAASAAQRDISVAVGDVRSDVDLLAWADIGVAMGHAPDDVKAVADHIARSVHEDGLADVVEALLAAVRR